MNVFLTGIANNYQLLRNRLRGDACIEINRYNISRIPYLFNHKPTLV